MIKRAVMQVIAYHSPTYQNGSMGRFASVIADPSVKVKEVPRFAHDGSIKKVAVSDVDGDYIYTRVRAVSDLENWGSNKNGDAFPHRELDASWHTFIGSLNFKNHESDKVENAIGHIPDAYWNKEAGFVECLIATDRQRAPNIVRGIEKNEITDVSMGCRVEYSDCSVCGNRAHTEDEYCDHVKNNKGRKIWHNGSLKDVYEINHGLNFFEVSWVIDGADPHATVLEKIAKNQEGVRDGMTTKEAYNGGDLGSVMKKTQEDVKGLDNNARQKEIDAYKSAAEKTATEISKEEKPRQQGYKPGVLANLGRLLISLAAGEKQDFPDGGGPVEAELMKPNPEAEMAAAESGMSMPPAAPVDPAVVGGAPPVPPGGPNPAGEEAEHGALGKLDQVVQQLVTVIKELKGAEDLEHTPPVGGPPVGGPPESKGNDGGEEEKEGGNPVGKMADAVNQYMSRKAGSTLVGAPIRHVATKATGRIAGYDKEKKALAIKWDDKSESLLPVSAIQKGEFQVRTAAWPHELLETTPMDYGQEKIRNDEVNWYQGLADEQKKTIDEDYNRIDLTHPWTKPEGGWRQEAAARQALSRVAWDAKFFQGNSVNDSGWTLYANGKPVARATVAQMWGNEAQSKIAEVKSKEYKSELLSRAKAMGIEHVADVWGTKPMAKTAQVVAEAHATMLKKAGKVVDSTDMSGLVSYYTKMYGDGEFARALTKEQPNGARKTASENPEMQKLASENAALRQEIARIHRSRQAQVVVKAMVNQKIIAKEAAANQMKKLVDMPQEAFAAISEMFVRHAADGDFPGSNNNLPKAGTDDPTQVGIANNSLNLEGGGITKDFTMEYPGEDETLTDAGPDLGDASLSGVESEISSYPSDEGSGLDGGGVGPTMASVSPDTLKKLRNKGTISAGDGATLPIQMRRSASTNQESPLDGIFSTPSKNLSGNYHHQSRGFVDPRNRK